MTGQLGIHAALVLAPGMLTVAAAVRADDFPDAVTDGGGRTGMLRPAHVAAVRRGPGS
jgi:hypothetical protein